MPELSDILCQKSVARLLFVAMTASVAAGAYAQQAVAPSGKSVAADNLVPRPGAAQVQEPASAGISAQRLERLTAFLAQQVEQSVIPGAVVGILRRNRVVYLEAVGHRHDEAQSKLTVDAVFDLSRLSEPLVAAGALILQEQGNWLLQDRIGRYLPQFKRRPVRVIDLLRHSAGVPVSLPAVQPDGGRIRYSLQAALNFTGEQFADAMAQARNWRSPGQTAREGLAFDLLGLAMEASTEQTLGSLLLTRLFIPLDMWDTGFNAGEDQLQRAMLPPPDATIDAYSVTGGVPVRDLATPVSFDCGGACVYSSTADYLRFLQMLLNNGRVDGKRVMSRLSVRFMTSDRLDQIESMIMSPDESPTDGAAVRRADGGFGLGVAVRTGSGVDRGIGSAGEFSRAAPTGPYFWADPSEQMAVVVMTALTDTEARMRLHRSVRALALQAIDD